MIAHIDASGGRVELQIHPEDDAYAAVEDTLGAGSTRGFNHDGFKRCSPLRLLMPFIPGLANASRVVFLDVDAVVLCDIEQVSGVLLPLIQRDATIVVDACSSGMSLTSGLRTSGLALHQKAKQTPCKFNRKTYSQSHSRLSHCSPGEPAPKGALPCAPQYGWQGVNNGALLMRLDRIRSNLKEYWGKIMGIISEKAYRSSRFSHLHELLPENLMKQ